MRLLRHLSIHQRLLVLTSLTLIGLVITLWLALAQMRGLLMGEKVAQVKVLVDVAQSVESHFGERVRKGELDLKAAERNTLGLLRDLRYDGNNYFWVMDLKGRILMHPIKPELDGTSVDGTTDATGKPIFTEMTRVARRDGQGMVDYLWPKPGSDRPEPKVAYVHRLADSDWVVATGIYVDDVDAAFWHDVLRFGGIAVAILLVIAVMALVMGRSVVGPARAAARAMRDVAQGDGDLRQRLDVVGRDEIADIAAGFNEFAAKTEHTVICVGQATSQIAAAAEELSAITHSSSEGMDRQRGEIEQVATAVTEMSATIQEIARNAEETAAAAAQADQDARSGGSTVERMVEANQRLAREVERIAESIRHFSQESEAIGGVLDVIRQIAEQTNLLALNAAIEAARAGEQGRGFAVVADEVRSLAGRTQQSTSEIQEMIETLRLGAQGAVSAIQDGETTTRETLEQASHAMTALSRIVDSVTRIRDMSAAVASAAEEQAMVAGEIDRSVVRISDLAEESLESSRQTAVASEELTSLGEGLQQLVGQFKVGAGASC